MVREIDNLVDSRNKFVNLLLSDHQRWRDLQYHEIIPANLCEDSVAEQPHHHNLSEHGGMNSGERIEWSSQRKSPRGGELDAQQQSPAPDFFHHPVAAQHFRQSLLQLRANLGCALTQPLAFEHS